MTTEALLLLYEEEAVHSANMTMNKSTGKNEFQGMTPPVTQTPVSRK